MIEEGTPDAPVTHGICPLCYEKKRREIDELQNQAREIRAAIRAKGN